VQGFGDDVPAFMRLPRRPRLATGTAALHEADTEEDILEVQE